MTRLLDALMAEPLDGGTDHFDASNLEVTTVDVGNGPANVIPAEARAVFNIRFNDRWNPRTLRRSCGAGCRGRRATASASSFLRATNAVAFLTEPDSFVTLVCGRRGGRDGRRPKLSTTGGTSDARFIKNSCPVVEFGLVGRTMHQVDERVAVADLDRLTAIYRRLLDSYFPR
jgi:succinyl-diaminopimelate desuccinylase